MQTKPYATKWIICPKFNPQASLRLFCFPYAGGGASIFHDWPNHLSSQVEVCSVQLPGRESRLKEAPIPQIDHLIEAVGYALYPYMNKPFALFGHSMGALICFELARFLRKKYDLNPTHLFVSGCRAPHLQHTNSEVTIYEASDSILIERLRRLNGTPQTILQDDELMKLLLPAFRADFTLCDAYTYVNSESLDCYISVFGGTQDVEINRSDLLAWQEQTSGNSIIRLLPGDHFFLHSSQLLLLDAISRDLEDILPR